MECESTEGLSGLRLARVYPSPSSSSGLSKLFVTYLKKLRTETNRPGLGQIESSPALCFWLSW